jgi:hypothetical protein
MRPIKQLPPLYYEHATLLKRKAHPYVKGRVRRQTMSNDDVEIKILTEEAAPLVPENPPKRGLKNKAADSTQHAREQAAAAAKKAWQSDTRKKLTRSVGRGAKKVVKKGGQAMTDVVVRTAERQARQRAAAVQERLQETDWKEVSKEGAATGLRWLSRKLSDLAARFTPSK